jgi:transcriptional regulator with XRE-family HTH domain
MPARSHKTLGDVLREARVDLDLGLRELARHLKKSPSYLSDIENDRRVPSEDVLAELAKVLHLDFERLMALAGRLGSDTIRLISRSPEAVSLFRRISALRPEQLREIAKTVEELSESKARKK